MPEVLEQVQEPELLTVKTQIPRAFAPLFEPSRYKISYGGRGGAKSKSFAKTLLIQGRKTPIRVLCAREFQISINDSVHQMLRDEINIMEMNDFYDVTKTSIRGLIPSPKFNESVTTGTNFLFKGLRHNISEIKSTEGIDRCWVEEAQRVSAESWQFLIPTIRQEESEIWASFNPDLDTDPTWQMVINPAPDTVLLPVSFRDNPFFPEVLRKEMEHCRATDPEAYDWIWEGNCRSISDAVIIKRARIDVFDTPKKIDRFHFGADFGFANDPNTLDRMFIKDKKLYIDYSVHAVHCELNDMPALYDQIPESRKWPIKADAARPETISYLRNKGFMISAAAKWKGSVEDGLAHLNAFDEIIIHERCTRLKEKRCLNPFQETRMYKYKVDPVTGEVLPKLIKDKNNHHIDGWRYGLDGYIQRRGVGSNLVKAVNT